MKFKYVLSIVFLLAGALTAFNASAFDGQWIGEIPGATGSQTVRLSLKTQGVRLTGMLAIGTEQQSEIEEGIIEGNTRSVVRFKTKVVDKSADAIALWTGTLKWGNTKTADEIVFVREAGPLGGRIEFNVKRVP